MGGGGGGNNNLMQMAMLMALANQKPPSTPTIDDAASQRNMQDQTAIRRRLASTQLTGPGGLPDLGATKVPVATSAAALLAGGRSVA